MADNRERQIDFILNNVPSCINCERFDEGTETCLMYNARPPARVIARGCEVWEQECPF